MDTARIARRLMRQDMKTASAHATWDWMQISGALKALGVEMDPKTTFMPFDNGFQVQLKDGRQLTVTVK